VANSLGRACGLRAASGVLGDSGSTVSCAFDHAIVKRERPTEYRAADADAFAEGDNCPDCHRRSDRAERRAELRAGLVRSRRCERSARPRRAQ